MLILTNYYEILGLEPSAGHLEIKTAFRKLAKIYHPDRNPNGKDYFEKILKAYETLSDPVLKSAYDYKLNYHQTHTQQDYTPIKKKDTKQWRFDEKELKRRQYYNEHFKKHTKENVSEELERKSNYNEYKYILFATPLAVILFLLIMKLAGGDGLAKTKSRNTVPEKITVVEAKQVSESKPKLGESFYSEHFGDQKYFKKGSKLSVRNNTGSDVVVCIFKKGDFIRSFYIPNNDMVEIAELPKKINLRYSSGRGFYAGKTAVVGKALGGFSSDQVFYESKILRSFGAGTELILVPGINANFRQVNEEEFFKRTKYDKKD